MNFKAELRGMATAGLLGLAGLLLLVSVPPGVPGVDLLQSLRFYIASLGIPLAIVLFLARAPWRGLLTVLLVLASVGQGLIPVLSGFQARAAVTGATLGSVRVLSFNLLASNQTAQEAADFIIATAPDIAVIMETPGILSHLDRIGSVLPYRVGCENGATCDLAVFSRTPWDSQKMLKLPPYGNERLAIATTTIAGVPLTVAGLHLSKPYFDGADLVELRTIYGALRDVPGRMIVAGDFNAAPWSNAVADFRAALQLVPPPTHPGTWPVRAGDLGVPIDNIFTRGAALIEAIDAPDHSYGSNHRALRAEISLRAAP